MFTDAGMILITTISDLDDYELDIINLLNSPNNFKVINIGQNQISSDKVDLQIGHVKNIDEVVLKIKQLLKEQKYLIEYNL